MDEVHALMLEAIQRNRKYAGFFDWAPDRDLAELGVARLLAGSLEKHGSLFFAGLKIRGRGNDPPDLEAVNGEGLRVAIEVTELVDGDAIKATVKNHRFDTAVWDQEKFLSDLNVRLMAKNACFQNLKGGPYPGGYVVVVFTDELYLDGPSVERFLNEQVFVGLSNIDRAFLLLSYFSDKGYQYFELKVN